jgi:lipoprotein-releasing system permease protein
MMRGASFPLQVALRFLREGRMQSVLILGGAGVGVAVLIFLSCLITSLQNSLITQTLGSQAHIVVRPPDRVVAPVLRGDAVLRTIEQPAQRLTSIEQWPRVVDDVANTPGVQATSPVVSGSAQALRGLAKRAVTLRGIVPDQFDAIIGLQSRITTGEWRVTADGCLIGTELARELGVGIGDRLRVLVDEDHSAVVRVQGIFDLGAKDVNLRWLLVPLRQAQTLFSLDGGVSLVEARVDDIFRATEIAMDIAQRTGLIADSWMTLNAQLMVALQSQGSSSNLIQFFVIIAVALGISSVLVVSVVQKRKEVGILRAMGASRAQIQRVFLWQGAIVGLAGSFFGTLFGLGMLELFKLAPLTFTIETPPALIARACVIALVTGIVAAVLPARRAARLDPAVAIRAG